MHGTTAGLHHVSLWYCLGEIGQCMGQPQVYTMAYTPPTYTTGTMHGTTAGLHHGLHLTPTPSLSPGRYHNDTWCHANPSHAPSLSLGLAM